ncbi:MAG: IS1 family transposase [Bacteroidetes bacterium]|nr:IS1 family transposase [Bacteroidota bacterium]
MRVPVWVAYSRRRGKVVAHTIGASSNCAIELYNLTKRIVGNISCIYTDGNSSYRERFSDIGISDLHKVAPGKSQTHLIESVNSSIRDNLARFNRRSKRFSKTLEMLDNTLLLFFHRKQFYTSI